MDILEIIDDRGHYIDGRFAGELIKPFPCPDQRCSKSFNRKSDLQRHYRIHTNERPYACNTCGKAFIQRSALTVHFRTHTGEKPHKCEYIGCGKCFSDSSSLARHRRIHTGKRPYGCHIGTCEKRFVRKTSLTKHQQKTHNIKKPTPETSTYFHDTCSPNADADAEEGSDTECETTHSISPAPQKPSESLQTFYTSNSISRAHTPSNLHPTPYHYNLTHGAPLTPHASPSFTEAPQFHHHQQHQPIYHQAIPPTPQRSPQQPQIKQEHPPQQTLRMTLSPPTPYHILAQTAQSSPGSMSSCSSISTASAAQSDYFCHAPASVNMAANNPTTMYQLDPYGPMPVPLHIQQIAQMQLVGAQFPLEQPQQQQQMPMAEGQEGCWFEVPPFQQQQQMLDQQEMQRREIQMEEQTSYYGEVPVPVQVDMMVPVKQEAPIPVMMGYPNGYC